MKQKLLFIYNANAGTGRIRPVLSKIIEGLSKVGYEITIYATQAPREATEMIAERGEDYSVIITSGGDGTINEVISGVMALEKKPTVGYFPTGTVNDFARSLKIPMDASKNLNNILAGHTFSTDICSFNGRVFNYVAAFGAFTEVSYETPQKNKNAFGKMAYFFDAMGRLPDIKGFNVNVKANGMEIEGKFAYGMISNSKSVGGYKLSNRKNPIYMDDGVFEVVLIKMPKTPLQLEQIVQGFLTQKIDGNYIIGFKAACVEMEFEEDVKWTLDGENGGSHKKIVAECHERAINIFSTEINRNKNEIGRFW